jgi:hypothetical protein
LAGWIVVLTQPFHRAAAFATAMILVKAAITLRRLAGRLSAKPWDRAPFLVNLAMTTPAARIVSVQCRFAGHGARHPGNSS